jgi:hypothetical protein
MTTGLPDYWVPIPYVPDTSKNSTRWRNSDIKGNPIYWIECIRCGRQYHQRVKNNEWPKDKSKKYVASDGQVFYASTLSMLGVWSKECDECKNKPRKFLYERWRLQENLKDKRISYTSNTVGKNSLIR